MHRLPLPSIHIKSTEVVGMVRAIPRRPGEFVPGAGANNAKTTMGKYVEGLLAEQKYMSTIFPRIPVPLMRQYKKDLLLREMQAVKDRENEKYRREFKKDVVVEAEYFEDNKWYEATINNCLKIGKYLVTFNEYHNQEEVSIGLMRPLPEKKRRRRGSRSRSRSSGRSSRRSPSRSRSRKSRRRSRSADKSRRRRSRSRDKSRERRKDRKRSSRSKERSHRRRSKDRSRNSSPDLDEIIKRKERDEALAVGRDYAKRPTSYKTSLSIPMQIGTNRKRSRTPPIRRHTSGRRRRRSESPSRKPKAKPKSKEYMQKMAKLKERYGDASAAKKTKKSQ